MRVILTTLYIVAVTILFNQFSDSIIDYNARFRNWVVHNKAETMSFDTNGIPISHSPRYDTSFISPFYVVHFGLIYSDKCQLDAVKKSTYHWKEDTTIQYWPHTGISTLKNFKASVEWLAAHTNRTLTGQLHFLYDFDWNYPGHGVIRKPWWSGLTDGHAITLFLRAYDCFGDPRYLEIARELYTSVTTPVSKGGSLIDFAGHPWIEEYVDPLAIDAPSPRVLNGMAYAYFGVRAYEEYIGKLTLADPLNESIKENIGKFDLGYWSYYDAIRNHANIKYHNVNTSLLEDPRLYSNSYLEIIRKWEIGRDVPLLFFSIYGPNSIERYQYILSYLILIIFPIVSYIIWLRRGRLFNRGKE